jgi:oxepin-CoA hydrolase/3-oxo-5,6-dehydrosuberyl-CoA semialdehyde dehydrogenase
MLLSDFIPQIESLSSDVVPNWGKMTPQHVVEHLLDSVQMSVGKVQYPIVTPEEKLPLMMRFLMSDRPFAQNAINPAVGEGLQALRWPDLEAAKASLFDEIRQYDLFYAENTSATPTHLVFGILNHQQWNQFHKKHFTHHLTQFGLLSS